MQSVRDSEADLAEVQENIMPAETSEQAKTAERLMKYLTSIPDNDKISKNKTKQGGSFHVLQSGSRPQEHSSEVRAGG